MVSGPYQGSGRMNESPSAVVEPRNDISFPHGVPAYASVR